MNGALLWPLPYPHSQAITLTDLILFASAGHSGLDCGKVNRIEAIIVTQQVTQNDVG